MALHLYSKHYFLTYPQTSIDNDIYLDVYATSFTEHQLLHYTIANETHEDGSPHLHVLLSYTKKLRVSTPSFFDIVDYTGELRHPNIQISSAPHAKWLFNHITYCKKDGNFLSTHPEETPAVSKWTQIYQHFQTNPSSADFMQRVFELDPRSGFLYYEALQRTFQQLQPPAIVPTLYTRDSFVEPEELSTWVTNNLAVTNQRRKSLLLVSPSRFGKTQWARSLGKCCVFAGKCGRPSGSL